MDKVLFHEMPVKLEITGDFMAQTFGSWLRSKREVAGMNQSELARRSRVTKTTISMYEADKITQPRFTQLDKIAKALAIETTEIRQAFMEYNGATADSHDLEGVRISFLDGQDLSDEDKEEILKLIRRQMAAMKAEKENPR